MVKTEKLDAEKNLQKAILDIFKNVAEYKNIDIPELNSFDDVPQEVADALRDIAGRAASDIFNKDCKSDNVMLLEELTKDYTLSDIADLLSGCMKNKIKHQYYGYFAGIGLLKSYMS